MNTPPTSTHCEIITPPHVLKIKAGNGGGLDETVISRGEAAMERIRTDYPHWLGEDIERLQNAWQVLDLTNTGQPASVSKLYRASHDLRGQAASFDFPTVTRIAHSLCRLLEALAPIHLPPALVGAHVDAIGAAYRENRRNPDDPLTAIVLEALEDKVDLACEIAAAQTSMQPTTAEM
ncbi:MAG: Hpt domain-containing protein [Rhizomicrobium sp.]